MSSVASPESGGPVHVPVLVAEVLAMLAPRAGEVYLDCTAGLGGHAAVVAGALAPGGTVVLNDLDAGNLVHAEARVRAAVAATPAGAGSVEVVGIRGNFAEAPHTLAKRGLAADLVLADLGFSSNQIEAASRGFSFMRDGPLDMRLDPSQKTSAADLVRSLPEDELTRIIRDFGEDRAAGRIARKIVQSRASSPITTTGQLAEIVRSALGPGAAHQPIHPATRTFQAIRIAVNDELGSLEALLHSISRGARGGWLKRGARIGIISFHSLEDRLVKRALGELEAEGLVESLSRKPIEAGEDEVQRNVRSRSAKLRAVRVTGG